MRRADRLFQIVQLLRRDRATTAARLSAELEVSERTVYRDVRDLLASGVAIQGEAGVGYMLPSHFDLPPLMFTADELEALALGARMVQAFTDDDLARAARSVLAKVEHVVPQSLARRLDDTKLFVPDFYIDRAHHAAMQTLRQGLEARRVVHLHYQDENGAATRRDVRPLGLFYWGRSWTLVAWCELRTDFRSFRLDRIGRAELRVRTFADEPGRTLDAFLARVTQERAAKEQSGAVLPPGAPRAVRTRGRNGAPADPGERAAWRAFQQLGSIGPACAQDLLQLGFRAVDELRGQDPRALYQRLCELTGSRQDPCVEDVLRCAIAQADDESLPAPLRQWHRWTPLRGEPPSARPVAGPGGAQKAPARGRPRR
jgi:predicted DNA-binding transcriptional regulator YafY